MAPKKKGNKKGQDDWEAELGESIAPAGEAPAAEGGDAPQEDDEPAGGLMAIMRKNKEKRKKKGGPAADDFVEGEDAPGAAPAEDLTAKAPTEATMDDEWNLPNKKGKGAKGKPQPNKPAPANGDDDELDASGRVLTKAEKEKLKKEREKQRKKEQVRNPLPSFFFLIVSLGQVF